MALSGTFQNYPVSSFGLYCEWSGTQSVTGNYTDITLKVYLSYYSLSVGARSDSTISINGTSETYTAPAISDYSSGWKKKLLEKEAVEDQNRAGQSQCGRNEIRGGAVRILAVFRHLFRGVHRNDYCIHLGDAQFYRSERTHSFVFCNRYYCQWI